MYTRNILGELSKLMPFRLRYLTDDEKAAFLTENGFPAETAVDDMEEEAQKTAYWRHQSKVQQKKADSMTDYEKFKNDSAELEKVRRQGLDDQARAVEEAREEARREGENIGAEKYLKDAVMGKFQALTGRTDEEVATTFEHVDAKSFTDDKGDIVAEKLKAFAATFGLKDDNGKQEDPVAAALARQQKAGGGSGGSIAEKRKATRESMTKTKA